MHTVGFVPAFFSGAFDFLLVIKRRTFRQLVPPVYASLLQLSAARTSSGQ